MYFWLIILLLVGSSLPIGDLYLNQDIRVVLLSVYHTYICVYVVSHFHLPFVYQPRIWLKYIIIGMRKRTSAEFGNVVKHGSFYSFGHA